MIRTTILPIALALSSLLLLSSCAQTSAGRVGTLTNTTERQRSLEDQFRSLLEGGRDGEQIELAALTPFEWDTLYLFGENSSGALINTQLGTEWADTRLRVGEFEDLLVFTHNGQIVQFVTPTGNLFAPLPSGFTLPRERALFEVREAPSNHLGKIFVLGQP
jgi:hypothetical protein